MIRSVEYNWNYKKNVPDYSWKNEILHCNNVDVRRDDQDEIIYQTSVNLKKDTKTWTDASMQKSSAVSQNYKAKKDIDEYEAGTH